MSDRISKEMAEAVVNDPSIFMYDQIYDDIKAKPKAIETSKARYTPKEEPLKSKYIDSMKRGAYKKERQREIISQKVNLKKAKLESNEENVFITSAYLEQQQEKKKIEEEMRRQQEYDQQHTVNKDKDMIAFSKYLLKNQVGGGERQKPSNPGEQTKGQNTDLVKQQPPSKEIYKTEEPKKIELLKPSSTTAPAPFKPKFYSQKTHQMKKQQK